MKTYANLTREQRIKKIMDYRREDLVLILENLSEDLNISAILRSSEGFGVGKIYIIHSEEKKPKLSKGASSGASKWLNIEYNTSIKRVIQKLKKDGFRVIGTLVDPASKILWEEKFRGKIAILVGNEARGISIEAQKLTDENIYIPMLGLTESLNVSVACAILLYEVIRQKENI